MAGRARLKSRFTTTSGKEGSKTKTYNFTTEMLQLLCCIICDTHELSTREAQMAAKPVQNITCTAALPPLCTTVAWLARLFVPNVQLPQFLKSSGEDGGDKGLLTLLWEPLTKADSCSDMSAQELRP